MDYGTYPTPVQAPAAAPKAPLIGLQQLMAMMQARQQAPPPQQGGGGGFGGLASLVGGGGSAAAPAAFSSTGVAAADAGYASAAPSTVAAGSGAYPGLAALPIAASGYGMVKAGDPDTWKSGFLSTDFGKWNPYSAMIRGMAQFPQALAKGIGRIF